MTLRQVVKLPLTADELSARVDWRLSPICRHCVHWNAPDDLVWNGGHYCAAFPYPQARIPNAIWRGETRHTRPYGGEERDPATGAPILFTPYPLPDPDRDIPAEDVENEDNAEDWGVGK